MPKPSAQGRAKIAETTAPSMTEAPTPDGQPPQDAGVSNALMANLLATLMAKIDEFRREQSTHGPVSAMQSTHGPATITQSTHCPATITRSTHCPATIAQSTHGPVASTSAEPGIHLYCIYAWLIKLYPGCSLQCCFVFAHTHTTPHPPTHPPTTKA